MLSESEQKFLNRYKTELEKPRWKFVAGYGLGYGFLLFLVTIAFDVFYSKEDFTVKEGLVRLVIWLLGGLAFGWYYRWFVARHCKKLRAKQEA